MKKASLARRSAVDAVSRIACSTRCGCDSTSCSISRSHARAARLARLRSPRWLGYTRAKALLAKLDNLLTHPKTHRMPNLLIVGDTNAGKTMLAHRFVQGHRADDNPDGDAA